MAPLPVKIVLLPVHSVLVPVTVTVGLALIVMDTVEVFEQETPVVGEVQLEVTV